MCGSTSISPDAGADPEWNGPHDGSLIAMARDRGHAGIAQLLEVARDRRGRVLPGSDSHPIHAAITREDTERSPPAALRITETAELRLTPKQFLRLTLELIEIGTGGQRASSHKDLLPRLA